MDQVVERHSKRWSVPRAPCPANNPHLITRSGKRAGETSPQDKCIFRRQHRQIGFVILIDDLSWNFLSSDLQKDPDAIINDVLRRDPSLGRDLESGPSYPSPSRRTFGQTANYSCGSTLRRFDPQRDDELDTKDLAPAEYGGDDCCHRYPERQACHCRAS